MSSDVADEQTHLSTLYAQLDELRERASTRLRAVLGEPTTNHQARSQRDAANTLYTEQLAQYDAAENNLCFGRIDFADRVRRHIGRIGLPGTTGEPMLVDWRAPAARAFYLATVASPEGVVRRRHIQTRLRTVTGIHDEVLGGPTGGDPDGGLSGESALLAALTSARTGQMADIVATIQAEQDAIIRADQAGVLVVDGGPGTGKTAVALHRAAYLLYTHRETLASRAVLIVGPNPTFLRYIGRVLPGLGETAVVLATVGDLVPGVEVTATEPDAVAEVKGRAGMAAVLAAAVADRQRVPADPWEIDVDRETLFLDADTCARARDRARSTRLLHNRARPIFVRHVLDALARQLADRVGADPLGGANLLTGADIAALRDDLRVNPTVRAALDELWPLLSPERLLTDLFGDADLIGTAGPDLPPAARALLRREPGHGWTVADVALLDEAAELLGVEDVDGREEAEEQRRRDRAYAEGVLDILSRDIDDDPEILMAHDLIDSDRLADRHVAGDGLTVAERAAADRQWAYGHVIVDEAQELSAMAWRMLMRRCPSRSMTLVGDVAQTSDPAGTTAWDRALSPHVADRWRLAPLTVNYRTPAEIMSVAEEVLRGIDPHLSAPRSIRSGGERPWRQRAGADRLADDVAALVDAETAALGDGRLGVLVPPQCLAAVREALPHAATGDHADLTSTTVVLTVRQAKGLEFDSVLVVEPGLMLDGSARGANDLYVALTRATRRLGIVHTGEIPAALATVAERSPVR